MDDAERNFQTYIEDTLLKKEEFNEIVFDKLYNNSIESLEIANSLIERSFLWTIVTGYYSMFYMASAYVYKRGYKAQHQIVHKVINDALIFLSRQDLTNKMLEDYNEEKEKALSISENLLGSLEYERAKRSRFQYEMTEEIKKAHAKTTLLRAKEFVSVFRQLMGPSLT